MGMTGGCMTLQYGSVLKLVAITVSEFLTVGFSLVRHPADPIVVRKSLVAAFAFR